MKFDLERKGGAVPAKSFMQWGISCAKGRAVITGTGNSGIYTL
jgi:hypothetical protein